MSWRKIKVNGETYRWKVGKLHVIIQNALGKRICDLRAYELKGITPDEWERAQWKGGGWYGAITPSEIRSYIERTV